ncbi:hypothetical protein [Mesorhizobium sp. M0959]|uniref:hypothetical protein n=1 Tax=unclassified Mesorhizobium TaxID=325217 RepID=UPI0033385E00
MDDLDPLRQSFGSGRCRIAGRRTRVTSRHLGIGWESAHVCIDDALRVALVEVMTDQRKRGDVAFWSASSFFSFAFSSSKAFGRFASGTPIRKRGATPHLARHEMTDGR